MAQPGFLRAHFKECGGRDEEIIVFRSKGGCFPLCNELISN